MRAYERLLRYVQVWTTSEENSAKIPSTERQFALARQLANELRELGAEKVQLDEHCYVYAQLAATSGCEQACRLGFIAHLDTAPDFCGRNVQPQVITNYDGQDVILGNSGQILRVKDFPHLQKWQGRTLITTDGTTLLGADDKAGIAEIMTLLEQLQSSQLPHGPLRLAFTPDEEVGAGATGFNLESFDADFAYTVDGDCEGGIEYENFNAYEAIFEITGINVHTGSAKNIMINAQLIAMEINSMLPAAEIPALTEGYEGFYHLHSMIGTVEYARLEYIVRDHAAAQMTVRLDNLRQIVKVLNEKYGAETVKLTLREQYSNMAQVIREHFHLIENAVAVCEELNIMPQIKPIRGGTDGARLSYQGLPCPNLGTGGHAFHGPLEHISAEGMDMATAVLRGLVQRYASSDCNKEQKRYPSAACSKSKCQ